MKNIENIPLPSLGRRIAVGDVHGCYDTLQHLLEESVKITPNDQLFLLGDYINRGQYSAKVLDYIISLKNQQYQVYPLRGNHEQMLLQAYGCGIGFFESFLLKFNSQDLLNGNLTNYLEFCDQLAYCFISEDFLFTHLPLSHQGPQASLQIQRIFPDANLIFDNQITHTIVHGHQAISLAKMKATIEAKSASINLDSGCVYASNPELGHLCALNLDSFELFSQSNID